MKLIITISICILFATQTSTQEKITGIEGIWKIDLRPTPESKEYFQLFEIKKIKKNIFEGTFYGSTFKKGLLNTKWDRVYFSFTTSDASNDYYHSGYFLDGKIYGISYCPNRKFTAPWKGVKK
ncbi:MAG: hypothetical protein JXQ93_06060 [Flavobacteriaceae bacterium]